MIRIRPIQRFVNQPLPHLRHSAILHRQHFSRRQRHNLLKPNHQDIRAPSIAPTLTQPLPELHILFRRLPIRVPRPREHVQPVSRRVRIDRLLSEFLPHQRRPNPLAPLPRQRMRQPRHRRRPKLTHTRRVEIIHPRARRRRRRTRRRAFRSVRLSDGSLRLLKERLHSSLVPASVDVVRRRRVIQKVYALDAVRGGVSLRDPDDARRRVRVISWI